MENIVPLIIVALLLAIALPRFLNYLGNKKEKGKLIAVRSQIHTLMQQYGERRDKWIIIDTETTGLTENDVIIEIGILSGHGEVLMDSRVKLPPRKRIGKRAQEIHGITREDLQDAPGWSSLRAALDKLAEGKECVAYNASFDSALVSQTDAKHGVIGTKLKWVDIMPVYNNHIAEWDNYRNKVKWQKLPGGDHSAIGDAKAVFAIMHKMGLPR